MSARRTELTRQAARLFAEKGYQIPKTLDDLNGLSQKMQQDGLVPFAFADVPYLRAKGQQLNAMLATQANANGALTQVAGDKSSTIVFPVPVDVIGQLLGTKGPR